MTHPLTRGLVSLLCLGALAAPSAALAAKAPTAQVLRAASTGEGPAAPTLGANSRALRKDRPSGRSLVALVRAKGPALERKARRTMAANRPPGAQRSHHEGRRAARAFVGLAARAMGMSPRSLMQEIYKKGLPAVMKSKGFTEETLVAKMTEDVANHAASRGTTVDRARVRTALTRIYRHLLGEPVPPAPKPSP